MEYNITGICMIGHFYLVNTQIEANIYNKKKVVYNWILFST